MRVPLLNILNYYLQAKTVRRQLPQDLQSFAEIILDTSKEYYVYKYIEHVREDMLRSDDKITMIDFGAGSRVSNGQERKISEIAKSSLSSVDQCKMIFNLINWLNPDRIVELGTSLGISTAYLASVSESTKVITLEGNPDSARIAQQNFRRLNLQNIEVLTGAFEDNTDHESIHEAPIDLVFIDGNHRYQPTLDYFDHFRKLISDRGILIFDDIYWSQEMNEAWKAIQAHESVANTVDLYFMGIVFFDPIFKDQKHVKLISSKYKFY